MIMSLYQPSVDVGGAGVGRSVRTGRPPSVSVSVSVCKDVPVVNGVL